MGFAELDLATDELRRVQDDEQRITIDLDLRTLMRMVRVFHGEVVQPELFLQLVEQFLVRLMQANPDEVSRLLQRVADLVQIDVGQTRAIAAISDAIDDHRRLARCDCDLHRHA